MANHNLKINIWPKHTASSDPTDNREWNLNDIHTLRFRAGQEIAKLTSEGHKFLVYHNDKLYYDSELFKAKQSTNPTSPKEVVK